MIVKNCWHTDCPYRFVDPKPVKEREQFNLTEWECPDIIHCLSMDGICVKRIEQVEAQTKPQDEEKTQCISIKFDGKHLLYAYEGTEWFSYIMNLPDGAIFEHHGNIYQRKGNRLQVYVPRGTTRFDMQSPATRYGNIFSVDLPIIREEEQ